MVVEVVLVVLSQAVVVAEFEVDDLLIYLELVFEYQSPNCGMNLPTKVEQCCVVHGVQPFGLHVSPCLQCSNLPT